jgi:methyl-accepting chemotaxis protein
MIKSIAHLGRAATRRVLGPVLILVVATVAIAVAAGSAAVLQVDSQTIAEADARLDRHATDLAQDLDGRLSKVRDDIRLAAQNDVLDRAALDDPAAWSPVDRAAVDGVVTYLGERDVLEEACVLGPAGNEVACWADGRALPLEELPTVASDEAAFRSTMSLSNDLVHMTAPFVRAGGGDYVIGLSSPIVRADGSKAGIVRVRVPLAWLTDELALNPFGGSAYSFILNGRGRLEAHPRIDDYRRAADLPTGRTAEFPPASAIGSRSWEFVLTTIAASGEGALTFDEGGQNYRLAYRPLLGSDRSVVSVVPESELYAEVQRGRENLLITVGPMVALMVVLIALFAVRLAWSNRRFAAASQASAELATRVRDENERTQASIVKLLDEVSGAADGDLTVEAEVTSDVTGAIADSFNYTISQLRELVQDVQTTTSRVATSALQLQAASVRLAESGGAQAEQIGTTLQTVGSMASSIERVSSDASQSAKVAERSLTAATDGARAVAATIEGMNRIRERVQETGQRTKRLGERSQEIGEAVTLIDEIADRTSILALNASIQAAAAGDAGRGFTVVAEEIQRLAEQSADATKRIALLVKAIQSETGETVVSMDEATREVVDGSALADQAGRALAEIESVSDQLAAIVGSISEAAGDQARQTTELARSIGEISVVTNQNALGATESADEMGALVRSADRLRESVSAFRLSREWKTDDQPTGRPAGVVDLGDHEGDQATDNAA